METGISTADLQVLLRSPLFAGLEQAHLAELLEHKGICRMFRKREPISGYTGQLGVLLSGRLRVVSGSGTLLNRLEPSALFGVSTIFTARKSHVTDLFAEEESRVLLLEEEELETLFASDRTLSRNYLAFLTGRIRFLNQKIDLFTAATAEQKLLSWLRHQAQPVAGQLQVELPSMSHLAELLGMGRASLYRAADKLQAQGIVEKRSRKLWILHLQLSMWNED